MKLYSLKQSITLSRLLIIGILIVSSCSKEKIANDNDAPVTNDNYYVKYVISSIYPKIFSNWSVTTPEGNYTKNDYQTRSWGQTYGPVKKGFNCAVQVGKGEPTIEIYVSKNQEPFALKTTVTGPSAFYTIDF